MFPKIFVSGVDPLSWTGAVSRAVNIQTLVLLLVSPRDRIDKVLPSFRDCESSFDILRGEASNGLDQACR
jgi:hypothetical protein